MANDKPVSYIDLGFNQYGLNTIGVAQQMPSNLADYILEVAENSVTNNKVKSISASKLTAGVISAIASLGDEAVKLDGENRRIIISDGTNDRVLIGYQSGGF